MRKPQTINSRRWSSSQFALSTFCAASAAGIVFAAFGGETALFVVLAFFLLPIIGVWPTMLIPKDSLVVRGIVVGAMLGLMIGAIVGYARL